MLTIKKIVGGDVNGSKSFGQPVMFILKGQLRGLGHGNRRPLGTYDVFAEQAIIRLLL